MYQIYLSCRVLGHVFFQNFWSLFKFFVFDTNNDSLQKGEKLKTFVMTDVIRISNIKTYSAEKLNFLNYLWLFSHRIKFLRLKANVTAQAAWAAVKCSFLLCLMPERAKWIPWVTDSPSKLDCLRKTNRQESFQRPKISGPQNNWFQFFGYKNSEAEVGRGERV